MGKLTMVKLIFVQLNMVSLPKINLTMVNLVKMLTRTLQAPFVDLHPRTFKLSLCL
jgi:hypothetical protein